MEVADEELAVSRNQGKISRNQGISVVRAVDRPTDDEDDCSQMSSIR